MAINIKDVSFESLTDEQKKQILNIIGIDIDVVKTSTPVENDNLDDITDENV